MIINEDDVKINIVYRGNLHSNLELSEVEDFFSEYKEDNDSLKPRETKRIDDSTMHFADDEDKNIFYPYVYKTCEGNEKWILFMKDEMEGYALYENPQTKRMQLAWYHRKLLEPLSPDEEKELITCYQPKMRKDN
ncbi:MAG: hypothetical protein BZ137_06385 [Methanosphaera sp. rholeuAM130]|nr:MAG: hypothetical protein BZ137_06385 [Methanosphaera sp. rholeuAM130]